MSLRPSRRCYFLSVLVVLVAVTSASGYLPVAAQSRSVTTHVSQQPAYVVLDNNGGPMSTSASECSVSTGCANGIRFEWNQSSCFNEDRYPPVVIVWTIKGKVVPKTWPLIAPCSTGIRLWWGAQNHLQKARWQHSPDPRGDGLAVCFQHSHQCNKGHCVTAGCLPKGVDGADIFFQGGEGLKRAEWMKHGKAAGSVSMSEPADDAFWYGYPPPASPFANAVAPSRGHVVRGDTLSPRVVLRGRDGRNYPQETTSTATGAANGIEFAWYLPLMQKKGPDRGCVVADHTAWTSPPVAFEYTTGGVLNERVPALSCPHDASGNLLHFNHLDFSWTATSDGTRNVLNSAIPNFDGHAVPAATVPQPPNGTDGLIFGFHRDNYQSSSWTDDGAALTPFLNRPEHTRMATWSG